MSGGITERKGRWGNVREEMGATGGGEREKTVCNEEALDNVHGSFIANPKEAAQLQSDRERLEMVRGAKDHPSERQ